MTTSIIKPIQHALLIAQSPVIRPLHLTKSFKALIIGFNAGMTLNSHIAKWPSKLTVLKGAVLYISATSQVRIDHEKTFDIVVDEKHKVIALQNSMCLLTQGEEGYKGIPFVL